MTNPKRILFLMSDTGGGHRAAAEAIRAALYARYGQEAITAELVDVYRLLRYPANKMPEFYPWIIKHGVWAWELGYRIGDTRRTSRLITRWMYRNNRARLRRMVQTYPADVVVCVHSIIQQPSMDAYLSFPQRPPFVTVITDLVSTPAFWYDPRIDLCMVPTQEAFERGLQMKMRPEQMLITGLPVHPDFTRALDDPILADKGSARDALGWSRDLPAVLMVAGGDGMGPVFEMAQAIVERCQREQVKCQLAIVSGRNKSLKAKLEEAAVRWSETIPVHVYGFVTNMPHLMSAADILVTKAGPGTICEACMAGLPMIISGLIPGQEDGNVHFVVNNDAGTFAPGPQRTAEAVAQWLSEPAERLQARAANARKIARPDAVWRIAEQVWEYAHRPPVARPAARRKVMP